MALVLFAPFSPEFMAERADFHDSSLEEYEKHMAAFLWLFDRLHDYSKIVLWFGREPFSSKSTKVVMATLKQRNFQGALLLFIASFFSLFSTFLRIIPSAVLGGTIMFFSSIILIGLAVWIVVSHSLGI